MSEIRAVLLDAGGTLIHPDHEYILDRLAAEGVEADEEAYVRARDTADAVVGEILRSGDPGTDDSRIKTWFTTLLTGLGLPGDRLAAVGADIRARHDANALWVRPVPGTRQMLERLRDAGLRLAVISNADGRVARFLERAGLADLFELILDSGELGVEKPDPRIFRLALDRLGLEPDEAVFVGDTWEVDVLGARAAGIRPIYLAEEPREDATCISGILALPAALGIEGSP